MQPVLYGYLPILVFLVIAGGIATAMVGGSLLAARQKPYPENSRLMNADSRLSTMRAVASMFGITLSPSFSSSSISKSRSCFRGPSL